MSTRMGALCPACAASAMVCIMSQPPAPHPRRARQQCCEQQRQQRPGRHGGPQVREHRTLEEASTPKVSTVAMLATRSDASVKRHGTGTRTRAAAIEEQRVVRAHGNDQQHADDVQDGQPLTEGHQQPGDCQHRQRERRHHRATRASERRAAHSNSTMARSRRAPAARLPTGNPHTTDRLRPSDQAARPAPRAPAPARHARARRRSRGRSRTATRTAAAAPTSPAALDAAGLARRARVRCLEVGAGQAASARSLLN